MFNWSGVVASWNGIVAWMRHQRIALLLAVGALLILYLPTWLSHHGYRFPVGLYVTVMGLATAVMTFHEGPTAGWIVFITALMVGEIRNLYTADREQTATFSRISDSRYQGPFGRHSTGAANYK